MQTRIALFLTALICMGTSVSAQKEKGAAEDGSFVGTWEGKMNDIPGVKLTISESKGKVGGLVVFYFQERKDENSPWHVSAEHPVEMLTPHVENKTLSFELQHHKCHDCAELGPNVKFRMELTGSGEAALWNVDESTGKNSGQGMKLVRSTEKAAAKHDANSE